MPLIRTSFLQVQDIPTGINKDCYSALPRIAVPPESSVTRANHHFPQDLGVYQRNPSPGLRKSNSVSPFHCDKEKTKKKRSRVSAGQLDKLERYFAADTNPTTAQRYEISVSLGMEERQTQIWFQNRYAIIMILVEYMY